MIFFDLLQFRLLQFNQLGKMIYLFCIGWVNIIENIIIGTIRVIGGIIIGRRINSRNLARTYTIASTLTQEMKNSQACQYQNGRRGAPTQEVHSNNNSL